MDSGWRLGHRPSLDGLRGIAVLLVILGHVDNPIVRGAGAYVGVGLFFSLSRAFSSPRYCSTSGHAATVSTSPRSTSGAPGVFFQRSPSLRSPVSPRAS